MPTQMQRFQAWLMPGFACFTLSVGVVSLAMNPKFPTVLHPYLFGIASIFMILGSLLILIGFLVTLTIPAIVWCFGWRGRLCRALKRKIKEGRIVGRQTILETDAAETWAFAVAGILTKYSSEGWLPESEELKSVENPSMPLQTKVVLAKQIRILERLVRRLNRGEV